MASKKKTQEDLELYREALNLARQHPEIAANEIVHYKKDADEATADKNIVEVVCGCLLVAACFIVVWFCNVVATM